MRDLIPDELEILARGYAWGAADASNNGSATKTLEGVEFGIAYRIHIEEGKGSRLSVQGAYASWKEHGVIKW